MRMKKVVVCGLLILALHVWAQGPTNPGNAPQAVRMAELLGNPDHFNGKLVTVIGYLVIAGQNVNADTTLSLNEEDYKNELGNGLGVVPNQEMLRDSRELTGMYVRLTGVIVTREWPRSRMLGIGNITECKVWSDPQHPRAISRHFGVSP